MGARKKSSLPIAPTTDINSLARRVADYFCRILGVETIDVDRNFLEAGGNSLMAMQVISRIRKELGVVVPIKDFFKDPTVHGVVGVMGNLSDGDNDRVNIRLPISLANINLVSASEDKQVREIIGDTSIDADLTIIGFRNERIKTEGFKLFTGYDRLGNVLFVSANKKKEIN